MNGPQRARPRRPRRRDERLIGLFLLGMIAFSPPLLQIFGREVALFGLPLFYLYVFGAWAGLILLMALAAERRSAAERPGESDEGGP